MEPMFRIGLTGGIAAGKSVATARLAELGAVVVDHDLLAREAVAPGSVGLAAIVEAFGDGVLTPDGSLDRPGLGALVFADAAARSRLNDIVHPEVRRLSAEREAMAAAADPAAVVVHDIPLLVETGQAASFDAVVVVDVPVEVQVQRMTAERGLSPEEAVARVRAQATREERRAAATHVIDNTGTLEELRDRVAEVYAALYPSHPPIGG